MSGCFTNKHTFFGLLVTLLFSGCAAQKSNTVSAELCEEVLTSFATVPINPQRSAQRRELIENIKAVQEESFGEVCSKYPGWRNRFDSAYNRARTASVRSQGINWDDDTQVITEITTGKED